MKLSNEPQPIGPNDWYYEHGIKAIELVHWVVIDGQRVQPDHIKIPWKLLEKSLERRNAEKAARAERRKRKAAPHTAARKPLSGV